MCLVWGMGRTPSLVFWRIQATLPPPVTTLLSMRVTCTFPIHFLPFIRKLLLIFPLSVTQMWGCMIHFTRNSSYLICGWIKEEWVLLKLCHFFSIFRIEVLPFVGDQHFWESVKSCGPFPQKHACPHVPDTWACAFTGLRLQGPVWQKCGAHPLRAAMGQLTTHDSFSVLWGAWE